MYLNHQTRKKVCSRLISCTSFKITEDNNTTMIYSTNSAMMYIALNLYSSLHGPINTNNTSYQSNLFKRLNIDTVTLSPKTYGYTKNILIILYPTSPPFMTLESALSRSRCCQHFHYKLIKKLLCHGKLDNNYTFEKVIADNHSISIHVSVPFGCIQKDSNHQTWYSGPTTMPTSPPSHLF